MNRLSLAPTLRLGAAALILALAAGCSALVPKAPLQPTYYALDGAWAAAPAPARGASVAATSGPTLIVNPPHAAAGFDSHRIIYVRQPHQLEYFAHSEWVDTPARMLAPLIVAAVEHGGSFRAVVQTPSAAAADLRLDTEVLRLQQEFGGAPSRVRFTLRATVVDNATRRVLAAREFDSTSASASEDTYGGVVAAHRAVQVVLEQLATFCAEAERHWQSAAAVRP